MARPIILIVDDEKNTRDGLARALAGAYAVATAENGLKALDWLKAHHADVVLSDLRMPGMGGMQLLPQLLARANPPAVILLTAFGTVQTAVEAMKEGAYDFLEKPVNLDKLDALVARAVEDHARAAGKGAAAGGKTASPSAGPGTGEGTGVPDSFVGKSAAMAAVMETVRQVAPVHATVLIQGESGTGKELVARAIHDLSPRAKKPFVAVHCAALAPSLLESELFGHEKGAYTGATEQRKGRFELADGGTLFLDEVGEISPEVQVKILRVLETRDFERVGGSETVHVDVRLVAATNRDLRAMVAAGTFRVDLFYRLYVVNIELPPLREREGDVALLVRHYLAHFAKEHGRDVKSLAPAAMEALCAYRWPGNVRELRNVMERMVVLATRPVLTLEDVPETIRAAGLSLVAPQAGVATAPSALLPAPAASGASSPLTFPPPQGVVGANAGATGVPMVPLAPAALPSRATLAAATAAAQKAALRDALARAGGNHSKAAQLLGISRRTLYRRIAALEGEAAPETHP